jgi:anaerobic selenocysteine-containing dehydrogenase
VTGASLAGSSLALMGFSPSVALAEVREFKLARATETRNTCPYCAVACGILMYGLGDPAKNAEASIIHIEGDPDHPVNRGTLCPKGAGLIDFIHSQSRLLYPEYRAPVADIYAPIRTGTDIVFLGGVVNYLLTNDKIQHGYVEAYTDLTFIMREDFTFQDGIYCGYDSEPPVAGLSESARRDQDGSVSLADQLLRRGIWLAFAWPANRAH